MFSCFPGSWIKYALMAVGVWPKPEGEGKYFSFYVVPVVGEAKAPAMEKHWNKMFVDTEFLSSKDDRFNIAMSRESIWFKECDGIIATRVKHYTNKRRGKCGFKVTRFQDVTENVLDKKRMKRELELLEKESDTAQKEGNMEEHLKKKSQVIDLRHELEMNSFFKSF